MSNQTPIRRMLDILYDARDSKHYTLSPWQLDELIWILETCYKLVFVSDMALEGAIHESCAYSDDDPDPTWHCCDWTEVVDRLAPLLEQLNGVQKRPKPIALKYDEEHDVMHIHFRESELTEDEEINQDVPIRTKSGTVVTKHVDGVVVRRSVRDGKIVFITVMDYSKKDPEVLQHLFPQLDLSGLKEGVS